jgi:chromosomal replication initiation ATPase DnaA
VAMWLARTLIEPTPSYPHLGLIYGNRDHSTALCAVRKIQRLVDANPAFGDQLRAIVDTVAVRGGEG